jgi:hypothetical protein
MKTRTFDPIAALATLLFALALLVPRQALASVEKKGAWPTDEKPVSFKYQGPRADGLDKLASAAGWSLVVTDKSAVASDRTIALSLTEQPPADVLEALLDDGEFVATRKGTLVRIDVRDAGAADATPPKDAASADGVTTTNGDDDVKVMGGHGEISKGRVARHVTVMGGSCDVYGRVTGDLSVMGGRVTLHDGAVIERDITTMGGHVEIEKGAEVRGHTLTLGGTIHKDEGAKVGEGSAVGTEHSEGPKNEDKGFLRRVGDAISNTALLFVLGVVMLAVAPKRMETLRVEVARSPMRQVGLGVVGFVGFLVAVVVLCITVVGIPVALIGILLGVVGLYGGMVAALTVLGAALVRHKSENVYVHLAVGCGVFLVVYPLPFVGPPLTFALLFVGVGVLVSTRFAGYFPARKKANATELDGEGPYR